MHEKLKALREDRIPDDEIYSTLDEFGRAGFTAAESEVRRYLTHDKPQLRYVAVYVLALYWDLAKYGDTFERLLFEDPDADVRRVAAGALGYVLRERRDSEAVHLLIRKLRETGENWYVRKASYDAIRDIWLDDSTRKRQWPREALDSLQRESKHLQPIEEILMRGGSVGEKQVEEVYARLQEEREKEIDWEFINLIESETAQ